MLRRVRSECCRTRNDPAAAPKGRDGGCPYPIVELHCERTGLHDHTTREPISKRVAQEPQAFRIASSRQRGRLHLDSHDGSVGSLDDEIDLGASVVTEVGECERLVYDGSLLA